MKFVKYIIIGFLGTGLDFAILYVLVEFAHLFYLAAAAVSIAIVVWISFTLNKYWTFGNYDKKYFRQLGKYLVAHSIGIGLNLGILTLLVEVFHLWYIGAKAVALPATLAWNFLAVKKWVFGGKNNQNFNC